MNKHNIRITNRILKIFFLLIILILNSCGEKKLEPLRIDPAFANYVISFTSGVVSNTTKIRVRLVQEVQNAIPGKELEFNPFSISPDIKGKAIWLDSQTIEFIPEKLLESGEVYTVEFQLYKFINVPENLRNLKFRFQVIKQAIQYEFNGIEPYDENDKKWQKVQGIFFTADYLSPTEIEESVKASYDGENFKLLWKHSSDGRTHDFVIDSVLRNENSYNVKLQWEGENIGANNKQIEYIEIPSINEFKILNVKLITNPITQIKVFFSDPLNKTQDFNGLMYLEPNADESIIKEGNIANIFIGKSISGDVLLKIQSSIKNVFDEKLNREQVFKIKFVSMKPQVELIGDGIIIPNTDGVLLPFRAVSLTAVDVTIIKIFENNITQFFQVNQFDGDYEIKRVGRIVFNQEIPLISEEPIDYGKWNTFSLDLANFIEPEPGAIYRVEISFKKKHSLYPCSKQDSEDETEEYEIEKDINKEYDSPEDYWYYYEDEYYYDDSYDWYDRDNPCKNSYYMNDRKVVRNVLASNMGIIAKAGTNSEYNVIISDLRTTDPISNVEIEFRNFQNQVIAKGNTNSDGICKIRLKNKPFLIIAKKDKQRGYLRIDDASSLSLSMFDIKGEELKKGVKGFLYGDRGVWRPGDSLYIMFILQDNNKSLTSDHPVVFELFTPENQLIKRIVRTSNVNGFYNFKIKTSGDSPTGNWVAKVKVGASVFSKSIRIETVKPNRMKIYLKYNKQIISQGKTEVGNLQVNWLHGTPAKNLKVLIEAELSSTKTEFNEFKDYVFDDPSKTFISKTFTVFQGTLNNEGKASVLTKFDVENTGPGMINVHLKTRAFETGGDFSIDRFNIKYSPYKSYVGIKIPEGKGWNNALYSNEKNLFPIVLVDENGNMLNRKLKVEVYSIYWRWWWDSSDDEYFADYVSNQNSKLISKAYINTKSGRAIYEMNLNSESWGRKFIKVTDELSGHSTGAIFYTTYKGWWSNAGEDNPGGAEMLIFQTNKKVYSVGENINVELPVAIKGKAYVSIETGSKIVNGFWVDTDVNKSKFSFKCTNEMTPNIYIHVTFIQSSNKGLNSYPIRMYGVQSVKVENPNTHIYPIITMKNSLKPLERFTVNVREKNKNRMTYTIAIVDEGLLDLTRFKTPEPWQYFYSHEALGVKTWDMYKYVAGSYTGKLAGLLAIGGDEYLNSKGKENTNRFKPVVLFKGPFTLKEGNSRTHSFIMPNYVGSVRVMVISGDNNKCAYGNAEKTVSVKQPLMILATLPRMVSPTEIIKVPVTVFSMDPNIKKVNVNITSNSLFEVIDEANRTITFNSPGEANIEFNIKVKSQIGQGKIVLSAVSGNNKATSETMLQVRMPSPPIINITSVVLKPGEKWKGKISPFGISGTNYGVIEVSNMLPINLEKRLQYLVTYPHGCIEQITSAVFPQLYIQKFVDLTASRKKEIENNIKVCLQKLPLYINSNGGFSYWPGEKEYINDWGTNYAGHFMIEAKSLGYTLPNGLLESWLKYQTNEANNWRSSDRNSDDFTQSYRLYTLALAKKPNLGAMNRLREINNLSISAKWRLAAAYALIGEKDISEKLIININEKKANKNYSDNYGSVERDIAMKLETLILLGENSKAKVLADEIAKYLGSEQWMSTQTTSYALLSLAKFIGEGGPLAFEFSIDNIKNKCNSGKPIWQNKLFFNNKVKENIVEVVNTSKSVEYLRIQLNGVPLMKNTQATEENLKLNVSYFDMKGNKISPKKIKQGTDFYVEVMIKHPGLKTDYKDLTVEQLFPSGWEIINSRLDDIESESGLTTVNNDIRYQDIRDDRVYSYFDLKKSNTKVFKILLHASYLGKFYLPSVYCSAMYDNTIHASSAGEWVEVIK